MTATIEDVFGKLRTAGALPSSRTEGMLAEALESDNIDDVKAQLQHVWGHYQSLEFALVQAATPEYVAMVKNAIEVDGLTEADPVEVVTRAIAGPVLEAAYDTAHHTLTFIGIGAADTVPAALRILYAGLDFSDPERELSDDELAAFFEPGAQE